MAYETFDPPTAHHQQRNGWIYVDVRSEQEFVQGHPEGAVNVPVFFAAPGGMEPNPGFVDAIRKLFPVETPLLMGCRSGQRSARACELLLTAGYTKLANVAGGFHGSSFTAGWQSSGLPVSTTGKTWTQIMAEEAAP
jgi:rhodanese-related sulfurtransferase